MRSGLGVERRTSARRSRTGPRPRPLPRRSPPDQCREGSGRFQQGSAANGTYISPQEPSRHGYGPTVMRCLAVLAATGVLVAACSGSSSPHWRGGSPSCVTTACPSSRSLISWLAVSVGPDDRTLTVRVPTACGNVADAQPVKVAQNERDVVIGFYGPKLEAGICASSARVSFQLARPLGSAPFMTRGPARHEPS